VRFIKKIKFKEKSSFNGVFSRMLEKKYQSRDKRGTFSKGRIYNEDCIFVKMFLNTFNM